jgi:hypothetical protein
MERVMEEDETIPRFSYDLIDWLDNAIADPSLPRTVEGFAALDDKEVRRAAFQSGARSLVAMLKAWRDEEEEDDTSGPPDVSDEIYGSLFRPDHGTDRSAPISGVEEITARTVLPNTGDEG